MLSSGCAGPTVPIAADIKPLCSRALRVVCVSDADLSVLSAATAQSILATNEAIRAGCAKASPASVTCPKGQRPKLEPAKAEAATS